MAGHSARLGGLFHQMHEKTLIGKRQGRRHSGQAASDYQRLGSDPHRDGRYRLQKRRLRHSHSHEVFSLEGGLIGLSRMDPGDLVAYIDHLKEAFVQPRCPERLAEKRFVGSGRACGDYDPVEIFLDVCACESTPASPGNRQKGSSPRRRRSEASGHTAPDPERSQPRRCSSRSRRRRRRSAALLPITLDLSGGNCFCMDRLYRTSESSTAAAAAAADA